ncbi:hypothetical protein [Maribellus maritimus]|uniref:hypothetical protein n=1 Tax=Maribellus maritimus TaxID=2870838 RepID=UPI001EEBC3AF|nr:hypothetical protein [Maribellus maritimus]MCG6191505.1 hypothetical protein [Maribellus maritimus]
MTTTEIIVTIFSSSVLSAGLTGLITWKIKQNEFKKTVFVNFINKRIEAYTELENLHGTLSFVIRDDDGKKYHAIYSRLESFQMFILNLGLALKFNTWYSPEIIAILRKVNDLQEQMGGLSFDNEMVIIENIKIGKRNYEKICNLKDELTDQIRKDFSKIHITDFKKFFGETKR